MRSIQCLCLLFGLTVLVSVHAQQSVQVKESGGTKGTPRVLTRNNNAITQIQEIQDFKEDTWAVDEVARMREEQIKTAKEEELKRAQAVVNDRRYNDLQAELKEKGNKIFLRELDRSKEQAIKSAAEETEKTTFDIKQANTEDQQKYQIAMKNIQQIKLLNDQRISAERLKLDGMQEEGEKRRREATDKTAAEHNVKEEANKRRAQQEQDTKKADEQIKKDLERKQKTLESMEKQTAVKVEQKEKEVQSKNENAVKAAQKKSEEAAKTAAEKAKQAAEKAGDEHKEKQKAAEERKKKCIELQVSSAGWPNNIWEFRVRGQVFNRDNQGFRRGYNVMILDPNNYSIQLNNGYDTYADQNASRQMASALKNAADGSIILIACQDECSNSREVELVNQFYALKLQMAQRIGFRQSYAAIIVKGKAGAQEAWPQNNNRVDLQEKFGC